MARKKSKSDQESMLITTLNNYKLEAETARRTRMEQNKTNYEVYHMMEDYAGKIEGQSREFLPKQAMAVEQLSSFLSQGLIDMGEWFKIHPEVGVPEEIMPIKPQTMQLLLNRQLDLDNFMSKVGNFMKSGFLGSLIIAKVGGKMVPKQSFKTETKLKGNSFQKKLVRIEDKVWQLQLDLVRQEDYYPDPTGNKLYEMQDIWMDAYEFKRMSEGSDALYDKEVVDQVIRSFNSPEYEEQFNKARETGQNITGSGFRNRIKVTEIWGNIINEMGELEYENVLVSIANDKYVLHSPLPNPLWHGKSPYVVAPIVTVPGSVWHKALMDAPTYLNKAQNELFNLMLDDGLMSVHGIKQVRVNWLDDPEQVQDGITPGTALRVRSNVPPGGKVLERIDTSTGLGEGMNVYNLVQQEFNTSAMTSDLRMGTISDRAVKATEVIETSQTQTSMLTGIAKRLEEDFLQPLLEKSWMTLAQHASDLDEDWSASIVGPEQAMLLNRMDNKDLFAATAGGVKFRVFGISATLNKQRDFTKLQAMLQSISAAPILIEEFAKKFSFTKLLEQIMQSLDIDTFKIQQEAREGIEETGQQPSTTSDQTQGANEQSQIPQAGAQGNQGEFTVQGNVPQTDFPQTQ